MLLMECSGLEVQMLRRDRRGVDLGTSAAPIEAFDASSSTALYARFTSLACLASSLACLATTLLLALRAMKCQSLSMHDLHMGSTIA